MSFTKFLLTNSRPIAGVWWDGLQLYGWLESNIVHVTCCVWGLILGRPCYASVLDTDYVSWLWWDGLQLYWWLESNIVHFTCSVWGLLLGRPCYASVLDTDFITRCILMPFSDMNYGVHCFSGFAIYGLYLSLVLMITCLCFHLLCILSTGCYYCYFLSVLSTTAASIYGSFM